MIFRRRKKKEIERKKALCPELEAIEPVEMPEGGCIECLAIGDTWVHLRFCTDCGETRCCDDSKNQHARKHAGSTGHPTIRSKEPGENWAWCYVHERGTRIQGA